MSTNGSGSGQNGGGDAAGRKRRNRKRRNRSTAKATAEFWGDPEDLPEPRDDIRITTDPSAVVRSLGRPPLPGQEQASEAYFAAVYARAVGLASALAAAGELIEPEELLEG
ncbi:MAG: hypothetical protein ACLGIZ_03370 [Acidimicrobiia bacterium]|jgi:hypothetical protein